MKKIYIILYEDRTLDNCYSTLRVLNVFSSKNKALKQLKDYYYKELKYLTEQYSDIEQWEDNLPIMESFQFVCEEHRIISYRLEIKEVE